MSEKKAGPKNPFGHPMVKVQAGQYVESVVYEKATGKRLLRWPIDAKELVATGDFSYEPVAIEPEPPSDPVEPDNDPPRRGPGRPRKAA